MASLNQAQAGPNTAKTRIHIDDQLAVAKFSWDLLDRLERYDPADCRPKILLCIGTDRSTGDSLGPLVGSKMAAVNQDFFIVYGTLDQPVHASNLKEKLIDICRQYHNPFIVAVDACLGSIENVGCLNIGNGSLQPGAGVNKNLPPVGEIHITGIVNVGGFMEYMVLQNTRLNLVMRMADTIVEGLMRTVEQMDRQKACQL
ncbi:spore protease YyaC [Desulfotomaculum copahuensis]|uniref:Spore protease YyaC n=1 Tax=Desulfotomaculum copahuensis TaxID=1838280 RepID=A0A1B7LAX7_9FIRM|nr:spore protease YyaC [Desulfotomaculum copahuensis]OAT79473.1 spore protease YyaC [Desulfotomaculum copahuensis]